MHDSMLYKINEVSVLDLDLDIELDMDIDFDSTVAGIDLESGDFNSNINLEVGYMLEHP
jgi:uncharacterized secreted protein with C-terminal beta-propeller domain